MLLIANAEAWPGFPTSVEMLKAGADSLTAMVAGISRVEAEPKVRSVGYGGWPNMLGVMECDAAVMDGNTREIGSVGAVPGWPGAEACPPQPMVTQTRAVLDRYAATGGAYREVVLPDVGHSPHVERPQEFAVALLEHLDVPAEHPANLR